MFSSAGIFAFKCARAEEIFNMLQEIMHSNSISVVEEPVFEPNHTHADLDQIQPPRTPTSKTPPHGCSQRLHYYPLPRAAGRTQMP